MRAYLLKNGNSKLKDDFINQFINEKDIPIFNIARFTESFKISDVREIHKKITAFLSGKNRVVIIDSATIEAQNALLKTIEELPDDTSFIFLNEQDLLPTIISRCSIVNLGFTPEIGNVKLISSEDLINARKLVKTDNLGESILSVEYFFEKSDLASFDYLIFVVNSVLKESIELNNISIIRKSAIFLNYQIKNRGKIISNNINPRLIIENFILKQSYI